MAALVRIYARYLIGGLTGVLVAKNLIPQELADALQTDQTVQAVSTGFLAGSAFVVEWLYQKAKKSGWGL